MNMNNLNDEEKKFLKLLLEKEAEPRERFKSKLKKDFIKTYTKKSLFENLFALTNFQIALLTIALFSILGIVTFNLVNTGTNNKNSITSYSEDVSEDEKKVILEKIIKNNSISLLDNPINKTPANPVKPNNETPGIIKPSTNEYNYRYTQTSIKHGNAFDACKPLTDYYKTKANTETFEYFSKDKNYYKYQCFDESNNMNDQTLIKESLSNGEYTLYKDTPMSQKIFTTQSNVPASYPGSYAVMPISYPFDSAKKESELISQYLKQAPAIIKVVKDSGKEYYILQGSFKVDCEVLPASFPVSFPTSQSEIFYEYWIDSQTYTVDRLDVYKGLISEDTLLWSANTITLKKNVEFGEVEKDFAIN